VSKMEIFKEFMFEAAHRLPNLPAEHKCGRLHGHSFRIVIHVSGDLDADKGWVMDFADVRAAFSPILDQIDHQYLNDIDGLEKDSTPTCHNSARSNCTRRVLLGVFIAVKIKSLI
jgi:6-pyruvoyltetrahydropterin/6-carboxytetrahydropterin synthase